MRILGDAIKKSLANKAIVKIQHREIDTISNCFDKVVKLKKYFFSVITLDCFFIES